MQRLLARPAVCHTLPRACGKSLPSAALGAKISWSTPTGPISSCEFSRKRSFGSERWSPKYMEESEEPAPVATVRYSDGPQLVEFWENDAGALVVQHDELEDIESCKWAIDCICQRISQPGTILTPSQKCLSLRFLKDLEDKVEKLSDEGYGTCAIEIFERPWVLTCGDNVEILCLRPRPDGVLKRIAFAALSPVFAPVGALLTYAKSNSTNSVAALKWYFRAVAELPSKVQLDSSYRVEGSNTDLEACASSLTFSELHRLISVQQGIPQLSI